MPSPYSKIGRLLLAVAVIAIGVIHFAFQNFPQGLLPVSPYVTGRIMLVYLSGVAMIVAGGLMLTDKYAYRGSILMAVVFVVMLLFLHLPKLFTNLHDGGEWTAAFEVTALFGGALLTAGAMQSRPGTLFTTGLYVFAAAILVFAGLHIIYLQFIVMLIPAWLPGKAVWAWVVFAAFSATFISLVTRKLVRLSTTLLAAMFLIWVFALHLPRVIASPKVEPEWTSMFIALSMAGISLVIAGAASNKRA